MIIEAFKNKIFPMIPTGFDPDEDEIPRMSPDEDEIPRMSPDEDELSKQYDELYKAISNAANKLDSALIRKYFKKGSLLELFKLLRYSQSKATEMMNLIYPIDLVLFLIFKIILNTSLKNMKLLQIILLYKFM